MLAVQERPSSSHDPWVGQSIGNIRIEECVHRGELATVYRGLRDDASVALKLYRVDSPIPPSKERVSREREAQRSVEHPCVARLLGDGVAPDGSPYLVSEWISGTTLSSVLEDRHLSWEEMSPILVSITRGLAAIHAKGIVHRDVKPENVMIRAERAEAVLLDFGHSLLLNEARLTERGWTHGSASYMAPEQAAGETLDGRADLYSVGVLLYRALTGVLPFSDVSPAVIMDKHRHEPVVPLRVRVPELNISVGAEDLVLWLMAKSPEERVPNARVLLHAIRSL